MEIPLLESGIIRFQNPNLLARFLELADLKTLWTWGALILAAVAAFTAAVRRTNLLILRFHKGRSLIPHPSFRSYSFSDSDDSDDSHEESCSSSVDGDDDKNEDDAMSTSEDLDDCGEIEGENSHFDWPELGGGVVKSWEGLGLGFDRSDGGSISILDLNRSEILRSFASKSGEIVAAGAGPPSLVLTAEKGSDETLAVRVWDAREAGAKPAAVGATWRRGRVVAVGGGDGRVFVGDDSGSVSLVDLRGDRSSLTETWRWGDGAVTACNGEGLVSWWRNAARCLTLLPESV